METLRRRAQAQLKDTKPRLGLPRSRAALVEELHIHQIELELQNEELRATQLALEASRDRYQELFELAPLAYLVISTGSFPGKVIEVNSATAQLLDVTTTALEGQMLQKYLTPDSADALTLHLRSVCETTGNEKLSVELQLKNSSAFLLMVSVSCADASSCLSLLLGEAAQRGTTPDALQAEDRSLEFVSLCAYCKKVRQDGSTWTAIEQWIRTREQVMFSHGLCPECIKKHWNP